MNKRKDDVWMAVAVTALLVAFFVVSIFAARYYERWRASIWAEEMRKAGVKTEAPR